PPPVELPCVRPKMTASRADKRDPRPFLLLIKTRFSTKAFRHCPAVQLGDVCRCDIQRFENHQALRGRSSDLCTGGHARPGVLQPVGAARVWRNSTDCRLPECSLMSAT